MIENSNTPIELNALRARLNHVIGSNIENITYVQSNFAPTEPIYATGNLAVDIDDGVILEIKNGMDIFIRWAPPGDWGALSITTPGSLDKKSNLKFHPELRQNAKFRESPVHRILISKTPGFEIRIWSMTFVTESSKSITVSIGEIVEDRIESSMDNICVIYDREIARQYKPFENSHNRPDITAYGEDLSND